MYPSTSYITNIKLAEAKAEIAIDNFHRDDLLTIILIDPCTLNESELPMNRQEHIKTERKRLAYLGDALIDAVLANYLFRLERNLTTQEFDNYRQAVAGRPSLTLFAINLGLPDFSSSWNRKNRQLPIEEHGIWGEMFEALVGAIFLDARRNFDTIDQWLCDWFLVEAVNEYEQTQSAPSHP